MNSPILLVGNSPNQVHGTGRSWGELLASLRTFAGMNPDDKAHVFKPFPLHFEEIRNRYLDANPAGTDSKVTDKVATLFGDLRSNDIHKGLMNLPFENVLTTNYDNCLEQAASTMPVKANFGINERSYSLFRRVANGDKSIWHVRGEVSSQQSIVLGQDRYVEACSRMRRYMDGDGIFFAGKDPVKTVFKQEGPFDAATPYSWVDLFLTSDVHIAGFGMDYSEADIWYLLSYRARKHRTAAKWVERLARTKVTVHMFQDTTKPLEIQASAAQKIEVLKSFRVNVIEYSLMGSSYKEQWTRILENLDGTARRKSR
jgi:hypothetical protein